MKKTFIATTIAVAAFFGSAVSAAEFYVPPDTLNDAFKNFVASMFPTAPNVTNGSVMVNVPDGGTIVRGIVIGKSDADLVYMIRAIGPGLSRFGIGNTMSDPKIEIYKDGVLIAESKMLGGTPYWKLNSVAITDYRETEKKAGAFPLRNEDNDAVLIHRFRSAGAYTIIVKGLTNDGSTGKGGTVMLEEYKLDPVVNSAPTIPKIVGSKPYANAGIPYKMRVSATDKDGEEVKFGFDWDDDGWVDEFTEFAASGKELEVSHVWSSVGDKLFRVIAVDTKEKASNASRWGIAVTSRQE